MRLIQKGTANVSVEIYIVDSTDGTPETSVVWNTSGIDLNYRRDGAAVVSITEANLSALTDAHSDGGFLHVSNGRYRLDVPDLAFATGVSQVTIGGTVTGMVVLPITIQLVDFDPDDAVRMGMTALPNAAADGAFGLPISDAGGLDLDTKLANTNEITVARMGALTDWIDGNRLDLIIDNLLVDTAVIGTLGAGLTNIPWNPSWDAEVQSEVNDALVVLQLDHLLHVADASTTTNNSIIAKIVSKSATAAFSSFTNTDDSLEAIKDNTAWNTATGFSTHTAANVRTEMDSNSTQLSAILNRLGDFAGTGLNSIKGFFQALFRKDAGVSGGNLPSEINEIENTFTGTYDATTESVQALKDLGDTNWNTATGFSTHTAVNVWAAGTRTLTANTNFNDLNAAGIRTAVGLATANLDTQLADIPTVSEFEARTLLTASYFDASTDTVANVTTVGSVTTKTGYALVSTGLNLVLVDGKTLPASIQIIAAIVAGKISGAGTSTEIFLGIDGVTTRVTVTVDASGNRSTVVYA